MNTQDEAMVRVANLGPKIESLNSRIRFLQSTIKRTPQTELAEALALREKYDRELARRADLLNQKHACTLNHWMQSKFAPYILEVRLEEECTADQEPGIQCKFCKLFVKPFVLDLHLNLNHGVRGIIKHEKAPEQAPIKANSHGEFAAAMLASGFSPV